MKNTYTIPEVERENIQKVVSRFQKKAAAYGKSLIVQFGEAYATERKIYENRQDWETGATTLVFVRTELVEVFDLTIDSEIIRKDGYTVVAKIEHISGGNIVNTFGEGAGKPEWSTIEPKCEHCGNNRHRRLTFIVRHEDGSEKQVGHSCLKDYCGINPNYVMWLNQLQDLILNDDIDHYDFKARPTPKAYPVVTMLALAMKVLACQGYVKSCEMNSNLYMMSKLCDEYRPSEAEMDEAKKMAEGFAALDNGEICDSMLANIQTLINCGYCKISHFGYLAYAPVAYEKYIERMRRKAERDAERVAERNSEYVGEVGQRITVQLSEMKLLTSWETMYGYTYLYKFIDTAGNVLMWFASRAIADCKAIKATVKDHTERDGVKQTIITRCKAA